MSIQSKTKRPYQGPAIFSYGFRPFFFLGALLAAFAVPLWISTYILGGAGLLFETGAAWHAHEMIFGYSSAVIAGFLLTAVPNWTGRPPLTGAPLIGLVLLWLAGRMGMIVNFGPQWVGPVIDSIFLIIFSVFITREILAGKNTRNLKIAFILALLVAANIGFHISQLMDLIAFDRMTRLGLGIILLLIVIIGGRVTPAFTANWQKKRGGPLPTPLNRFDKITMVVSAVSLVGWIVWPWAFPSGILLILAGVLNVVRLLRWKFWATFSEPLVTILHVGYAWVAAALCLAGAGIVQPDVFPHVAAIHAIGTGAIGVMTIAIMTRATLGHSGQALHAGPGTVLIYILVNLAAIFRVGTPFLSPDIQVMFTAIAAVFWSSSFVIFCTIYGRYLWRAHA